MRAILLGEFIKILEAGWFLTVNARKKVLSFSTLGGLIAVLGSVQAHAIFTNVAGIIIQKARSFGFQSVTLRAGGSIVLVNEETTAVHHAYIEASGIRRDFGDQGPGTHTTMDFPHSGDFVVLCGVHPKMKLAVHVE